MPALANAGHHKWLGTEYQDRRDNQATPISGQTDMS
jgi:hypothetical protein